jgi:uncharacterized protein YjbJ (UPF0337 family)
MARETELDSATESDLEGAKDIVKGKAKEAAGVATGNDELAEEGKEQKAEGEDETAGSPDLEPAPSPDGPSETPPF